MDEYKKYEKNHSILGVYRSPFHSKQNIERGTTGFRNMSYNVVMFCNVVKHLTLLCMEVILQCTERRTRWRTHPINAKDSRSEEKSNHAKKKNMLDYRGADSRPSICHNKKQLICWNFWLYVKSWRETSQFTWMMSRWPCFWNTSFTKVMHVIVLEQSHAHLDEYARNNCNYCIHTLITLVNVVNQVIFLGTSTFQATNWQHRSLTTRLRFKHEALGC